MTHIRFRDIPQFISGGSYRINVSWQFLENQLDLIGSGGGLDLDPDFQRAHVWKPEQQVRYVEFVLRGGRSSRDILWNCPTWQRRGNHTTEFPVVLVDGKQRLQAVRRFMRDEIRAFGSLFSEYTDKLRLIGPDFVFQINDLQTRAEVLQWYLDINSGGVVHTDNELAHVRALLKEEDFVPPATTPEARAK